MNKVRTNKNVKNMCNKYSHFKHKKVKKRLKAKSVKVRGKLIKKSRSKSGSREKKKCKPGESCYKLSCPCNHRFGLHVAISQI